MVSYVENITAIVGIMMQIESLVEESSVSGRDALHGVVCEVVHNNSAADRIDEI